MRFYQISYLLFIVILSACKPAVRKTDTELMILHHFINVLNAHQADSLNMMLTEGTYFQDSQNRILQGKHRVSQGWEKYWELFPDYHIEIENIFSEKDKFAVFGITTATYKNRQSEVNENQWKVPIAWQVQIQQNKIASWKMYGDTKIIYEIIRNNED